MEFVKYFVASFVALIVDYSTYWATVHFLDVALAAAATIGYATGLAVAYFLLVRRVFPQGWLSDRKHFEMALFALSGVLGLALTYGAVALFVALAGEHVVAAKLTAVVVSFFGIYLFRKKLVFRA